MTMPEFTGDEQEHIIEVLVRDAAALLSDAGLAELIAEREAYRRGLWADGQLARAEVVWRQLLVLADVKAERRQLAEAVEDALMPVALDVGED